MTILSDKSIAKLANEQKMIEPFVNQQVKIDNNNQKIISYGNSSFGYDARVSDEFKIFTNIDSAIVDPKNFSENSFVNRKTNICIIPPNSFALARTVEYFRIPKDILVKELAHKFQHMIFSYKDCNASHLIVDNSYEQLLYFFEEYIKE